MIPPALPPSISYPLLDFFLKCQNYDRGQGHQSVDNETYLTLLRAFGRGAWRWSRDDLQTLCRALFIKPYHTVADEAWFNREFDNYLASLVEPINADLPKPEPDKQLPPSKERDEKPPVALTEPVATRPNLFEPKTIAQSNERILPKGTKISHVAFRNDADLVEGVSPEAGVPTASNWEKEADQPIFRLTGKYLPVEGRAVQQAMRSLRQLIPKRQQPLNDLPATIRRVARKGYFDRVETRWSQTARIPLVLLIDRRGSMVAFHNIVDQWADAAHRQEPPVPVFYFQNCPAGYVFTDPQFTDPVALNNWTKQHPDTFVLILSDAGAARGLYSDERLTLTRQFLNNLRPRRIAWLNPMPRRRWSRSTAVFIARWVPMFALDSLEFANAFRYLKGKLSTI